MGVVIVMPQRHERSDTRRFVRIPDALNADVQDLVTREVARREKRNKGWLAKIFGKQVTDRDAVLQELKSANVMDDDRYFMATLSQRRIAKEL